MTETTETETTIENEARAQAEAFHLASLSATMERMFVRGETEVAVKIWVMRQLAKALARVDELDDLNAQYDALFAELLPPDDDEDAELEDDDDDLDDKQPPTPPPAATVADAATDAITAAGTAFQEWIESHTGAYPYTSQLGASVGGIPTPPPPPAASAAASAEVAAASGERVCCNDCDDSVKITQSAVTAFICDECRKEAWWGSPNVPVLCSACAIKLQNCHRCGTCLCERCQN